MEKQYLDLARKIIEHGHPIKNERTGKICHTIINADLEYQVGPGKFPLLTTRKSYWVPAIAEFIGYLKGFSNAADFRRLGCNTWNANANLNNSWLRNPYRKGDDDMGRVYGVQARDWTNQYGVSFDQLSKVVHNLSQGIDDRGEIITFHNPGEIHLGCLRACMHTHTFSLVNGVLFLTSNQRSCDVPLGLNFNQVQVYFFLALMAQITGNVPGTAYHKIVNAHIYDDQIDLMKNVQLKRIPFDQPTFHISPLINSFESLDLINTKEDILTYFAVTDYQHHDPIDYPFSV